MSEKSVLELVLVLLFKPKNEFSAILKIMLVINDHMTEKENIAEALEFIESFLSAKCGDGVIENWDGQTPRDLLISIRGALRRK
jgi:hypothetical protein